MPFECDDDFSPIEVCDVPYGIIWLAPERNIFAIVDLVDLAWCKGVE